jgi:hypothetical protein
MCSSVVTDIQHDMNQRKDSYVWTWMSPTSHDPSALGGTSDAFGFWAYHHLQSKGSSPFSLNFNERKWSFSSRFQFHQQRVNLLTLNMIWTAESMHNTDKWLYKTWQALSKMLPCCSVEKQSRQDPQLLRPHLRLPSLPIPPVIRSEEFQLEILLLTISQNYTTKH